MTNVERFAFHHSGPRRRSSDVIHVGLVNNMPDAAMRLTELQFARLLRDAAGPIDVRLSLFSLPEIPRGELARSRMEGTYADAATLPGAQVDALIVTGAEPRESDLRDEAFWPSLARLTDWAEAGTISTIFSCLASHAAVLHLDGIARRPLPRKLIGVFDCDATSDDFLLQDMPTPMRVPHARLNELPESELVANN
jgi:homoserine O-succinyltransferase